MATDAGDRSLRGYAYLQLGNCSLEEVQMDSALIFFKQSREIFKDSTDPATLSKLYRNIGALFGQRYQTDSQQLYFDRAIRIRRLLPDKTLLIEALALEWANTPKIYQRWQTVLTRNFRQFLEAGHRSRYLLGS